MHDTALVMIHYLLCFCSLRKKAGINPLFSVAILILGWLRPNNTRVARHAKGNRKQILQVWKGFKKKKKEDKQTKVLCNSHLHLQPSPPQAKSPPKPQPLAPGPRACPRGANPAVCSPCTDSHWGTAQFQLCEPATNVLYVLKRKAWIQT